MEPDLTVDFGPHLFLNIDAYQGPTSLDALFAIFDRLPQEIGMTPIMRPYVIENTADDGRRVVSALTMIAESHVSLHVFPDEEQAYFDLFSCRFFDRDLLVPRLKAHFPGGAIHETLLARGSKYRLLRTEWSGEHAKSRVWLGGPDTLASLRELRAAPKDYEHAESHAASARHPRAGAGTGAPRGGHEPRALRGAAAQHAASGRRR
jgi:hypothetical protein